MRDAQENSIFPFFSIVRGLLYVYGDCPRPSEGVVTMVHLQLQEVLGKLFAAPIVEALARKARRPTPPDYKEDIYAFSDGEAQGDPPDLSSKAFKRVFQRYLAFVFAEFAVPYFRIQQHIRQVKKKYLSQEKIRQKMQENGYRDALSNGLL